MLPTGHLATAYLISQIPIDRKTVLKWYEIVFIMFCGIIFDFDFMIPSLFGYPVGTHHFLPTHTPFAGIIYFIILYLMFRNLFSKKIFILAGIAMLSHMVLDDLSYWFYLIGLEAPVRAQIFWWYPFDSRMKKETEMMLELFNSKPWDGNDVIIMHLFKKPRLFFLEIGLPLMALFVFIRNSVRCRSIMKLWQ